MLSFDAHTVADSLQSLHTELLAVQVYTRLKQKLLYVLGFLFLGLGILGVVLPGLPGTIFLIISCGCFVRSNSKMYRWVTEHPIIGRSVKNYLETGGMPFKAKFMAVSLIWIFTLVSIAAVAYKKPYEDPYNLIFQTTVALLAIAGTWYILSRPTTH